MNHTASIPALPTAYDLLNTRIQRIIHAPAAQQACQACISRLPGEDEGDWAHLLESFDRSNQWSTRSATAASSCAGVPPPDPVCRAAVEPRGLRSFLPFAVRGYRG